MMGVFIDLGFVSPIEQKGPVFIVSISSLSVDVRLSRGQAPLSCISHVSSWVDLINVNLMNLTRYE